LSANYATEPKRRTLQLEAVAHIELQRKIDEQEDGASEPTSLEYILWLHREFCSRLPDELLWVEDPDSKKKVRVVPGVLRDTEVALGRHLPPRARALPDLMRRFEQAFSRNALSKLRQIVAVAAEHHRLLWIHPFVDGNGRVARLMSHAILKRLGVGSSLWSRCGIGSASRSSRMTSRPGVASVNAVTMAADRRREIEASLERTARLIAGGPPTPGRSRRRQRA